MTEGSKLPEQPIETLRCGNLAVVEHGGRQNFTPLDLWCGRPALLPPPLVQRDESGGKILRGGNRLI